jgi:hypothetical protein
MRIPREKRDEYAYTYREDRDMRLPREKAEEYAYT